MNDPPGGRVLSMEITAKELLYNLTFLRRKESD